MASGPPFSPPPPYDPNASVYGASSVESGQQHPVNSWLPPAGLPPGAWQQGPQFGQASGRAAMYELRPLSTGEVLDRTFSLYRSRFLLFAGIASVAAAVRLVGSGLQLAVQQAALRHHAGSGLASQLTNAGLGVVVAAIYMLALAITQAATVWAMGEVYLSRSASVNEALRMTGKRWGRYLGIALWQFGSGLWPAIAVGTLAGGFWLLNGRSFGALGTVGAALLTVLLVVLALVAGLILYLRNLLAVPAAVREDLTVRAAMRRSKSLSHGAKGKLFLVLLIELALSMVVGIVMAVVAGSLMVARQIAGGGGVTPAGTVLTIGVVAMVVTFFGYALISPVMLIGISMVYFDQRVRKEAYDVELLLGEPLAVPPVPMPPAIEPECGASGL